MMKSKRKSTSNYDGFLFLGILFIAAMVLWAFVSTMKTASYVGNETEDMSAGWTYMDPQGNARAVSLPTDLHQEASETAVLTRRLPNRLPEGAALRFRSQHQHTEIWCGEEKIYETKENGRSFFSQMVSSRWNFIRLPSDSGGKEITLKVSSPYDRFSGKIETVMLGDYSSLVLETKNEHLLHMILAIICGVIGIIILAIYMIFLRRDETVLSFKYAGIFILTVSLWVFGESKMVLQNISYEAMEVLTLLCLAFCTIPYYAFLKELVDRKYDALIRTGMKISFTLFAGVILFQVCGLYDLIEMLELSFVSIGICIGIRFYIFIREMRREEGEKKTYFRMENVVTILLALGVLAELMAIVRNRYENTGNLVGIVFLLYASYVLIVTIDRAVLKTRTAMELQRQISESRMALLMSQISPHFIYNTLNSIRALIKKSPDDAYRLVYDFSKYLRKNLDITGQKKWISFRDELEHMRTYLHIQQVRFGERVRVCYEIREEDFYVPTLSVQPIVENAVKHGICKKQEGGTVWIRSYRADEGFVVEVEDDGIGFDVRRLEKELQEDGNGSSIGLKNVWLRMREIEGAEFHIESTAGKGTKAVIRFPVQQHTGGKHENNTGG